MGQATEGKEPPVTIFAEILSNCPRLQSIDISYNLVEQKAIFCVSHGLKFTSSLKEFVVDGNPIGPTGLRFLLQAMNQN